MNTSRLLGIVLTNVVHILPNRNFSLMACLVIAGTFQSAHASLITAYYGDDDGFGVGVTSGTMDPQTANATSGDAPLTDIPLISTALANLCNPGCGPFNPGGSFDPFTLDGPIVSAVLTLRTGSLDTTNPEDGPNVIYLDGLLVDTSFIDGFSASNTADVETRSITLNSSFFSVLSDGAVSLAGTHISETSGSRRFQVDFLRLDITTSPVPIPAAVWLFGSGLLGLVVMTRRKNAVR